MVRSLFLVFIFITVNVFAKLDSSPKSSKDLDPALISIKYVANPCYQEKYLSLSRSPGFHFMKDGSVVTSRHTRFQGPFTGIEDFMKKLDVCTLNHSKMSSGRKDYRVIHDSYLFSSEVTKLFSGQGGEFSGGGATGYWIGPDENLVSGRVIVAGASAVE